MSDGEPEADMTSGEALDAPESSPDERQDASALAAKKPGISTSAKIPALRLHRSAPRRARVQKRPKNPSIIADVHAPHLLRLWRLLIGLVLLALAWAGLVVAAILAEGIWDVVPHQHPTLHLLVYLAQAVGACWLGIMALCCIVVGAFSLTIGLTSRGWQ